jgi:hypothetical protein
VPTTHSVSVEERSAEGLNTRTFADEHGNVDLIVINHGPVKMILVPKTDLARQNGVSDDDLDCLRKCRQIEDDEKRIQCIVLCPANSAFEVFVSVGTRSALQ